MLYDNNIITQKKSLYPCFFYTVLLRIQSKKKKKKKYTKSPTREIRAILWEENYESERHKKKWFD